MRQIPNNLQVLQALAQVCYEQGKLEESIEPLRRACKLQPAAPDMRYSLAAVLSEAGLQQEAIRQYQKVLQEHPDHVSSRVAIGVLHFHNLDFSAAINCFEEALKTDSANAEASYNLGLARMRVGQSQAAHECFAKALLDRPDFPEAKTCQLFNMHNLSGMTEKKLLEAHTGWAKAFSGFPAATASPGDVQEESGRPIRVGYVSADFRTHSVAFFISPILEAHSRENVESYCYASVERPDAVTGQIREFSDHWRDISALNDELVADLVRQDRIDILVDLSGHTAANRLGVFVRKPAPVQVSWIGYPGTTGLPVMDYRITDGRADPEVDSDEYHTERLVRLDTCFLCYEPPLEIQETGGCPAISNGYITFGSFNNLSKFSPETIALWSEVLRQNPGSRLLLKAKGLGDRLGQEGVYSEFLNQGIERDRVETAGHIHDMGNHLELYHRLDIALDTFPYNGTTTTCEALWMGVPVITLAGTRHASRVGNSLLTAAGFPDFVATSRNDYVSIATRLAQDMPELQKMHRSLRGRMKKSALMDRARMVNNLEAAYRKMLGS